MSRGRFITVEGIEGAGKSTLITGLGEVLRAHGITVCATREPGGTPLAEDIRGLVLARRAEGMPPAAELLLMFAARAAHVAQRIEPALARGEWVLCDRFTDASRAYQGAGRGLSAADIEALARVAHPGLVPDLTLLLDIAPDAGLARARQRGAGGDRFEDEQLAFFTRVREGYLALARAEPLRWRVLDATLPAAALLRRAMEMLPELAT
ncbi:MAG: dTMP kinase [Steroidobacteraceae bacterium]